jgi:hypothetical protein
MEIYGSRHDISVRAEVAEHTLVKSFLLIFHILICKKSEEALILKMVAM